MWFDRLRWALLPVIAVTLLVVLVKGPTSGRLAFAATLALVWYALSRHKTYSLDRDRFAGGKLGRYLSRR